MTYARILRHLIAVRPHRWQRLAVQSTSRDVAMIAGIRGGKSTTGAMIFYRNITNYPGTGGVALLSGPDLPTIKQTSLETILRGMGPNKYGRWPACEQPDCKYNDNVVCPNGHGALLAHNQSDKVLHLTCDQKRVLYRGGDNPDDLRGPAAIAYWADEVTLCKPELLPILQGRTLDTGGRGIVTGTPKGKNWFWRQVIAPATAVPVKVATGSCSCGTLDYDSKKATPDVCPTCGVVIAKAVRWVHGRRWKSDRWDVVRYPTKDNPGVVAAEVAKLAEAYAAAYGGTRFAEQELEADFVDWGGTAFPSAALTAGRQVGVSHWGMPHEGHHISIGVDPAGKGRDWWAIVALCCTCRAVVGVWRQQKVSMFRPLYVKVADMARHFRAEVVWVDETSLGGQAVLEEIDNEVRQVTRNCAVMGWTFTQRQKYELIAYAVARVSEVIGLPAYPIMDEHAAALNSELDGYEWEDDDLVTDCVMAFSLACKNLAPTFRRELRDTRLILNPKDRPATFNRDDMP